jgi:flagellar L-ring protein precursor FlgH
VKNQDVTRIWRSSVSMVCLVCLLSSCASTLAKLEGIGKPPPIAKVTDPTTDPNYKPLTWPLPETPMPAKTQANSLWQPGARAFFRDGRAARVGDILRVKINITDQAEFDNNTTNTRNTQEAIAAPSFFGLEKQITKIPFANPTAGNLASVTGSNNHQGNVTAKRKETVQTQVAAMVTQVLPNGNFVISGKQEFLMNFDIREVAIKGVVRPQDIGSDNTVDSTQVAEARITYGGRGQNIDSQQRRWGSQAIEAISPF